MRQDQLSPAPGSHHRRRRVGRGDGSGRGTYSGRGLKGQKSRSGGAKGGTFEGGQTTIVHRLPFRRGFSNPFRVEYEVVNVGQLDRFPAGTDVTLAVLRAARLIRRNLPVKVLGQGDLSHPVVVKAHRFSQSARAKIEAAGGRVEELKDASSNGSGSHPA
ncbi:MAG: 50S ribosomal protein L15 [Dehalococcoidia bacterium]|nr:50S ribosomal protein L15 [Dehalococcoidia bacterium]